MKDNYGDKISVHADDLGGSGVVYLSVTADFDDSLTDAALTPKKARKLAQKLTRAADEAEGIERIAPFCWLGLTEDQAKTVAVILSRVGGTAGYLGTVTTARKYAGEIYDALEALGVDGVETGDLDARFAVAEGYQDSIYFIGVAE